MLKCPCSKEIYPEIEYGVLTFKHKDTGNYCKYMNTFSINVRKLVKKQLLKAIKENDSDMFNVLISSGKEVVGIYAIMLSEELDVKKLKAKILMLKSIKDQIQFDDIASTMFVLFGSIFINNLNELQIKHSLSNYINNRNIKPTLKMVAIYEPTFKKSPTIPKSIFDDLNKKHSYSNNRLKSAIRNASVDYGS